MEVPVVDAFQIISKSTVLNTSRLDIEGAESADVVGFSAQPFWRPPEHLMTGKTTGIFHEYLNIEPHESAIHASAICNKFQQAIWQLSWTLSASKAVLCQQGRKGQGRCKR